MTKISQLPVATYPLGPSQIPINEAGVTKGIPISALGIQSGWTLLNEAWTFGSATVINIPTNGTLRFQVGDKIQLTQTTVKYFYVVGVAATTLTITGGSSYTLVNAAISAISISRAVRPFGFPPWFNWTPTYGGFTAGVPTAAYAQFVINGNICEIWYRQSAAGTSNATTFTIGGLPVATQSNDLYQGMQHPIGIDNNANVNIDQLDVAGTSITLYKTVGVAASWTASAGKGVYGMHFSYPIAA